MRSIVIPSFLAVVLGTSSVGLAQTQVATDPVGYLQLQIAAGTGTVRKLTVLSCPLLGQASHVTGTTSGRIDSLTSNTITDTSAAWVPGELSQAIAPKLIRITSGAAEGRTFLISTATATANTATKLTLSSSETVNLTTLGIATGSNNGDTYTILDCDTLSTLFGTPATSGFLGHSIPATADNVLLLISGAWNTFFYSTSLNRWTRQSYGSPDATNQPVKPEAAVLFSRIAATPLTLTVSGTVPMQKRSDLVKRSGLSFLASNWPVDVTLLNSQIQAIPNWVANSNINSADQVLLLENGAWITYWWTGTNWKRRSYGSPISDATIIKAGTGVLLSKVAATSADTLLSQTRPY